MLLRSGGSIAWQPSLNGIGTLSTVLSEPPFFRAKADLIVMPPHAVPRLT